MAGRTLKAYIKQDLSGKLSLIEAMSFAEGKRYSYCTRRYLAKFDSRQKKWLEDNGGFAGIDLSRASDVKTLPDGSKEYTFREYEP